MRRTLTRFAAIKPNRFLEPHAPTGLTGILTSSTPRSTLKLLYQSTLAELEKFPPTSVYRQSTEAVTKHRLRIVESLVPEGYEEWLARTKAILEEHGGMTSGEVQLRGREGEQTIQSKGDDIFVQTTVGEESDPDLLEWDGEREIEFPEGKRPARLVSRIRNHLESTSGSNALPVLRLDPEPPLTIEQIAEAENKIGAGLIEEVIQVAEGVLKLTDVLLKARVWDDLEEKPAEGQWTYFRRDAHTK